MSRHSLPRSSLPLRSTIALPSCSSLLFFPLCSFLHLKHPPTPRTLSLPPLIPFPTQIGVSEREEEKKRRRGSAYLLVSLHSQPSRFQTSYRKPSSAQNEF